jgi:hypothetical protein
VITVTRVLDPHLGCDSITRFKFAGILIEFQNPGFDISGLYLWLGLVRQQ